MALNQAQYQARSHLWHRQVQGGLEGRRPVRMLAAAGVARAAQQAGNTGGIFLQGARQLLGHCRALAEQPLAFRVNRRCTEQEAG